MVQPAQRSSDSRTVSVQLNRTNEKTPVPVQPYRATPDIGLLKELGLCLDSEICTKKSQFCLNAKFSEKFDDV